MLKWLVVKSVVVLERSQPNVREKEAASNYAYTQVQSLLKIW